MAFLSFFRFAVDSVNPEYPIEYQNSAQCITYCNIETGNKPLLLNDKETYD